MGRTGKVYCGGKLAGRIEETPDGYRFAYEAAYLADPANRAISATLPKRLEPYASPALFAFFCGLLAEGRLKEVQCRALKLDENDHFGRLLKTAHSDTIGDVTVTGETGA